jgi:hypothetical protein
MLVLNRKEGQWTEVMDKNGNVLRVRATKIKSGPNGRSVDLVFDDSQRNFFIDRPERKKPESVQEVQ